MRHLEFACYLHRVQLRLGGYILHEHTAGATSWSTECITSLLEDRRISTFVSDMCMYQMTGETDQGEKRRILKPTRWMSNSLEVL